MPLHPDLLKALDFIDTHLVLLGTVATVVGAWFTVRKNVRINLRSKRVDVAMHCNSRYDEVYETKLKLRFGTATEPEARSYYARFWGLKSDEFDYWLADLVDIETYCNWCFMTMKAFNDDKPLEQGADPLNFAWGWAEVGIADHQASNPWFYQLTEAVREVGELWRKVREAHEESSTLQQELRIVLYEELIDILEIVHKRSQEYRSSLLDGMTFRAYRKTLKKQPNLGLTIAQRKSRIREKVEQVAASA